MFKENPNNFFSLCIYMRCLSLLFVLCISCPPFMPFMILFDFKFCIDNFVI